MIGFLPTLVTVGAGLLLLALVLITAVRPLRRFARTRASLRADVTRRVAAIRAIDPRDREGRPRR